MHITVRPLKTKTADEIAFNILTNTCLTLSATKLSILFL